MNGSGTKCRMHRCIGGAINDWWGNGVGSTPYAVKHYKEAVRLNRICDRLEEKTGVHNEELIQAYGDNSLFVCRAHLGSFCYCNESVRYHGDQSGYAENQLCVQSTRGSSHA